MENGKWKMDRRFCFSHSPFSILHSPRSGLSSITILLLMVFLAVTGRVIVSMVDAGHQSYSAHLESSQALYVAEAGLEWASRAITFVSGTAEAESGGKHLHFDIKNNSGGTLTVTGLTPSWTWTSTPADTTQFYEKIRIDGGSYSDTTIWDYASAGSNRGANGEAVTFNTGPAVTLSNGSTYEFQFRDFKNDETGGSSSGNMQNAVVRVAFVFTPNSINVGRGSFTISVPAITSGNNVLYASTATIGSASRKLQVASLVRPNFGVTTGLTYVAGSASTSGSSNENMKFKVENLTGATISITSFTPVFTRSPEAWYQTAKVDGTTVFDSTSPRNGTGDAVTFSTVSITDGSNIEIQLQKWRDIESGSGGNKQDVAGTTFQVTFSDGSVIEFTP